MVFKPLPDKSRWEGVIVCAWIVLLDLVLLIWAWQRATDAIRFGLLVLIALSIPVFLHLLYRTWSLFTLEYWVDRNAITIRWANVRQIVPLAAIGQIVQGGVEDLRQPGILHWPAPAMRTGLVAGAPSVLLCATRPLSECLVIETDSGSFALSPNDPTRFLQTVQDRFQVGSALSLWVAQVRSSPWPGLTGESSVGTWLLGLGFVGVVALFGMLMVRYPSLPSPLTFRYNSDGLPEVVREKAALFLIPTIGLLAWVVNGLWGMWMLRRKEQTGAYMLWGGALIVQICSLLALSSLLP